MQYKSDDAVNRALEWHNTWYKGVQITVEKLGADKGDMDVLGCAARCGGWLSKLARA